MNETPTCNQCKEPASVGSRCFRHYVYGRAREQGLLKYRWFSDHFDKFTNMLRGRFLAIRAGAPVPPVEEFVRLVWTSDPRPHWLGHKVQDYHAGVGTPSPSVQRDQRR